MYYQKYFSGTIDSMALTVGETLASVGAGAGGVTTLYFRSRKTTPVLCNAIVEVLREIGLPDAACRLNTGDAATYGEIFPYGEGAQGVHVFFGWNVANNVSNHISVRTMLCPDSNINAAKVAADSYGYSTNLQITSANTGSNVPYRFYVTVKGDPKSFLHVMASSYAAPGTEVFLFGFGRGRDAFGNDVVCYDFYTGGTYFMDLNKRTYIHQLTPATAIASSGLYTPTSDVIVNGCPADAVALIPWIYARLAGVTLDNCYCVPVSLTTAKTDQAFLIGGEEYWLLNKGLILAKCPTKLNL